MVLRVEALQHEEQICALKRDRHKTEICDADTTVARLPRAGLDEWSPTLGRLTLHPTRGLILRLRSKVVLIRMPVSGSMSIGR